MRISLSLIAVLPLFAICQQQSSQEMVDNGLKKYSLETGSISYEVSGDASGEEVFTFDRFGWRSLRKLAMQFELYGSERTQALHEISDGGTIYRINHSDSTYRKRVDVRWTSQPPGSTPQQASESILFNLGGTYNSDSVLLGKTCQVWTFNSKALKQMWVWKGLVLKRITQLGENTIVTTATKVELDPSIEASIFQLPTIYQLKE